MSGKKFAFERLQEKIKHIILLNHCKVNTRVYGFVISCGQNNYLSTVCTVGIRNFFLPICQHELMHFKGETKQACVFRH